ncbi:proline hydroxylase [Sphingomonas sp. So64.6b]|uniref:2OG-Fe(II) oxygenase n=1 Tax=Sphingomonas sp. So64.6b TaxID=2997354 RepID=UPI0016045429|nr:2OG-Fe(II) oxygenase [Sphingomonas sp. So64.6b]QNA84590.1 proline hydroxylase [Sphingomonas sp. So64.6b]
MFDAAITRANQLVASGATADAVALLTKAADAGDVDALMQLAVWRLVGQVLPRDLIEARALLRRAVAIGHVDAALMEVALTANGSGGPPSWAMALSLLRTAAVHDPIAMAQLKLLDMMAIDANGIPMRLPTPEVLSTAPRIVRFAKLLTQQECAHIAEVAAPMLEAARIIHPQTGQWIANPIRTSDDAAIGPTNENLVVRALNQRIAAASGTEVDQGEPLTVLRYRPGQQYRPHLDTIQGAQNQRIKTLLVYLNEGFGGGETVFPGVGLTVIPRGGDAILFDNVLATGDPDPVARHAGLPVRQGAKWLATRWIRAKPIDPWTIS